MSSMEFTLQDKGVLASLCGGISGLTETLYSDIPGCNIVVEELMKTVAVKFKKSGVKLSDPTVNLQFLLTSSVLIMMWIGTPYVRSIRSKALWG